MKIIKILLSVIEKNLNSIFLTVLINFSNTFNHFSARMELFFARRNFLSIFALFIRVL